MPAETHDEPPYQPLRCQWPSIFTRRRQFDRQSENQPYIEYLQTQRFDAEEEEEEEDDEQLNSENGEGEYASSDDDDDYSIETTENAVGWDREKIEIEGRVRSRNDDTTSWKSCSNVRLFMTGLIGDEDSLQYRDQVKEVAGFCEGAGLEVESNVHGHYGTKRVALLDDRNRGGTTVDIHSRSCRRPYLGPLTAQQLQQELRKKRFQVESKQHATINVLEDEETDAERRLIFVADLDASTIETLAMTASRSQVPALKDLFYKYITGKSSIGVTIPSHGFSIFTLDFHIPYFALRFSNELLKDSRKNSDGKPLRESWELPFLGSKGLSSSKASPMLYEAQISVAVTGIDSGVWTAYGLVDTYFESKETVDNYHKLSETGTQGDPISVGQLLTDQPIWAPRDYFFIVFGIRMNQVLREWNWIVDQMEHEVKQTNPTLPMFSNDPQTKQEVLKFGIWNRHMVNLLRRLVYRLSDTTAAWNEFRRSDMAYFERESSNDQMLEPTITAVNKVFMKLQALLDKLNSLEKELCVDNPQGVHAHLSLEHREAAVFQQAATEHIQVLAQRATRHIQVVTTITIVFFPLALAASLFSTTGVLPFTPNFARFTYVLVVLAVLAVAIPIILFNWASLVDRSVVTGRYFRNVFKLQVGRGENIDVYDKQRGKESIGKTKTSWNLNTSWALNIALALKRRIFPYRYRKADRQSSWDLEMGCPEPLLGSPRVHTAREGYLTPMESPFMNLYGSRSSVDTLDDSPKCEQAPKEIPRNCELYNNSVIVAEPFVSTAISEQLDSPGHRFRLMERDEDLLHPAIYKTKLAGLQAHVSRESGIAHTGLKTSRISTEAPLSLPSLLQECRKFLTCILRNITVLRDAGFCSSTATFLQIDPNRIQVAFLRSIELEKIANLENQIDESKTSLENLRRLDSSCKDLLGDHLTSCSPARTGSIAVTSLRVLDLILVSHACSHMGDLVSLMSKHTSTARKFQISSKSCIMIDLSVPSEPSSISFSRRTLKCLSGFLCGKQVWVFHGPNTDPMDSDKLFLSTNPDAFADVWGPMWKITNSGKPTEVLRYDLDHGSVVPFSLISRSVDHSVRVEQNEVLCHWIPNSELEQFEKDLASTPPPKIIHPRLLIGACRHSVTPNTETCYCNLTDVNNRFVSNGFRRIVGSSPIKWITDSKTMGTTAGGAGVGGPTFQYSHTMKKDGTPFKEALLKRWKNTPPEWRPWETLLMRVGLQVSVCTCNSRRVRIVDLLAGETMKKFMAINASDAGAPWRESFEEMLRTDPGSLATFQIQNPSGRKAIEQYVTLCLENLMNTGIRSRAHGPFVALWVHDGQLWEIAFPSRYYGWTGFVEDSDSSCSFVVLEKCLVNEYGLGCCHPREGVRQEDIQRFRNNTPPVLETFLTISERAELPDGLCMRQRGNGMQYWSVGDLRDRTHCLKLGKRGKLEGESFRSKRYGRHSKKVLTGKWSSEGPLAASTRVLSALFTTPEIHTEHICDGPADELPPLRYLVLDNP